MPWDDSADNKSAYSPSYAATSSTPVNAPASPIPARKFTVIIAPFQNPQSSPVSPSWVGAGMANAIREKLASNSRIDSKVDVALGSEVSDALALPETQRQRRLWQIFQAHPKIDWVLTGSVKQFTHLTESAGDASKSGSAHDRMQATVKVSIALVDLGHGSVIAADEFTSVAWADEKPAQQAYQNVKFGTAQFWQTPLGLASRDAVSKCAAVVERQVPTTSGPIASPIRVIDQINSREITLTDNAREHASEGDMMYVCVYAADGLTLKTLDDPLTHQSLMARIDPFSRSETPTARLTGEKPEGVSLRGAVLTPERPARSSSTVASRKR